MRTIFKIFLSENERNLKKIRRIRTIGEQVEKRILKNNNLIRKCKDMDQQTYMKLLGRQADKDIEALHTELADVNKSLHNMTNMVIDPDNENFANHVEDSIQHYKKTKIDLEEAIEVHKGLKQGYQTVITALTKHKSMSRTGTTSKPDIPSMSRSRRINNDTSMETTHGDQRSVLETIMEDSNMPSTSTNTATITTSIKLRTSDDATASTTDMNINPDNLIGNVANITTTGVITDVTACSGDMTKDEDITILEHLSTPRTAPIKDSDDQNENTTSATKGSNASDGGLTNVASRDNSNAEVTNTTADDVTMTTDNTITAADKVFIAPHDITIAAKVNTSADSITSANDTSTTTQQPTSATGTTPTRQATSIPPTSVQVTATGLSTADETTTRFTTATESKTSTEPPTTESNLTQSIWQGRNSQSEAGLG